MSNKRVIELFDFHSHILPGLDDGSATMEECVALLKESRRQGVDGIAATPHFYADRMDPERFIKKRQMVYEILKQYREKDMPYILLGAEVGYYDGIGHSEEILKLRMEGTKVLLIEMPQMCWTQHICEELFFLNSRREVVVLLAHIERYMHLQRAETINMLRRQGIMFQASGSYFLKLHTRKKALKMLKNGMIDVLGSDCHNMKDRQPDLGEAERIIEQMLGRDYIEEMSAREDKLLER